MRVHQRRLVPVKAWARRSPVEQATELARLVVAGGPLTWRGSRYRTLFDALNQLLDDGIVHWAGPLLARDTEVDFDRIVELARTVVDEQFTRPMRVRHLVGVAVSVQHGAAPALLVRGSNRGEHPAEPRC